MPQSGRKQSGGTRVRFTTESTEDTEEGERFAAKPHQAKSYLSVLGAKMLACGFAAKNTEPPCSPW